MHMSKQVLCLKVQYATKRTFSLRIIIFIFCGRVDVANNNNLLMVDGQWLKSFCILT